MDLPAGRRLRSRLQPLPLEEPMKSIAYPPRLEIAHLPTPCKPLVRLGKKLGVELHVKPPTT